MVDSHNITSETSELKRHWILLLSLIICCYSYFPFTQSYSTTPNWLLLGLISIIGIIFSKKFILGIRVGYILIPWLLFIGWSAIGALYSYNSWNALAQLVPLIIAPFIAIVSTGNKSFFQTQTGRLQLLIGWVLLPITLLSLYFIVSFVLKGEYSHEQTYSIRFGFGHRNQFSQFLVLIVPILLSGLYKLRKRGDKIFLGTVIILIALNIIFLQCRSAMLVLLIFYPAVLVGYFLFKFLKKKTLKFRLILLGSTSLIILSTVVLLLSSNLYLFEASYGSGNERLELWNYTLELINESPIIGHGTDDWRIEILRFSVPNVDEQLGYVFYQRAHNEFLQTWAENGIVGLMLLMIFLVVAFYQIIKSSTTSSVFIKLAVLGAFVITMCLSFPFERLELLYVLFVVLFAETSNVVHKRLESFTKNGAIIILIICEVFSMFWYKNEIAYAKFLKTGNILPLQEMDRSFYSIDVTSLPMDWSIGNYYFSYGAYGPAILHYEVAIEHNPYHIHLLNNLASSYYGINNEEKSIETYRKVLSIDPLFVDTRMNLSAIFMNKGETDSALNHLLKIHPDFHPDNFDLFAVTIAQHKLNSMLKLGREPHFEELMKEVFYDTTLLLEVVNEARYSGLSYEDQLRLHLEIK